MTPPEPGTLIRVKQGSRGDLLSAEFVGKIYPVIEPPERQGTSGYAIFVNDGDPVWPLALYDDEYEIVEPAPTPQFDPGDRVVYTIPETFGGRPGGVSASRAAGETGTIVGGHTSAAVIVEWDNEDLHSTTSTEFLAHAPHADAQVPRGPVPRWAQRRACVHHA